MLPGILLKHPQIEALNILQTALRLANTMAAVTQPSVSNKTIDQMITRHFNSFQGNGADHDRDTGEECSPDVRSANELFLKGMDLPGGDLREEGMVHAENAVDCCQSCLAYDSDDHDASCHAWTFTGDGNCWLKGPVDKTIRPNLREGLTSGEETP